MSPDPYRSFPVRAAALALCGLFAALLPTLSAGLPQSTARPGQRTVRGTAVDLQTGRPLPGYRLYVRVTGATGQGPVSVRMLTTDAAGRFRMTAARGASIQVYPLPVQQGAGRTYTVDTEWLSTSPPPVTVVRQDIADLKIRVKLLRQRTVAVRVTGPDGRPVQGARIVQGYNQPSVTGSDGAARVTVTARTRPTEFLVASRDGRHSACVTVPASATQMNVRLRPAATLRGRVVGSDGQPASGLSLSVAAVVNGEPAYMLSQDSAVTTDRDGKFTVQQGDATRYYIAWAGGGTYKQGTTTVARSGSSLATVTAQKRDLSGPSFAGSVGRAEDTRCQEVTNFCLDARDNVLLCDGPGRAIRCVSQDDRLLAKWSLDFVPEAVDVREDGRVLVAGAGVIALLDEDGKVAKRGSLQAKRTVTSITHSGDDVFVCTDAPSGYAVYRLTGDLQQPRRIINGLSGCCGQMDVEARDGALYVAENGRFSVDKYDRDGKRLVRMTKSSPKAADYYGEGCCEPKNIIFGPDGNLYAASSGKMMVKRYSATGKFLGDAARVADPDGGCVRVAIALTRDGSKLYMLDTDSNLVRLLKVTPAKQ